MPSLTQRLPRLTETGPVIELAITPSNKLAMIDTGAEVTVIGNGIASSLDLIPIGRTFLNTPSSTDVPCLQFDIPLIFPNQVLLQSIIAIEAPLTDQHIQCLIGRDVLQHRVLIYNGYDNSFTLSF